MLSLVFMSNSVNFNDELPELITRTFTMVSDWLRVVVFMVYYNIYNNIIPLIPKTNPCIGQETKDAAKTGNVSATDIDSVGETLRFFYHSRITVSLFPLCFLNKKRKISLKAWALKKIVITLLID